MTDCTAPSLAGQARQIYLKTLDSIDPRRRFKDAIGLNGDLLHIGDHAPIHLSAYREVVLVGFGKASLRMGEAAEEMLGDRITSGLLVSNISPAGAMRSKVLRGAHPYPDQSSLVAGRLVLEKVAACSERSLIIFLISGGGSAMVEAPISDAITLADLESLNRSLVTSSAPIKKINMVRKRLSRIKGGRLGQLALSRGASVVALYVSDVNIGEIETIASNPVLPEPDQNRGEDSEVQQLVSELRLPESIVMALSAPLRQRGESGRGRILAKLVICDNSDAIDAAQNLAEQAGFRSAVYRDLVEGDYRSVAEEMLGRAAELRRRSSGRPIAAISGGEVSCPVHGTGTGGRNQEFVLYSAAKFPGYFGSDPVSLLSCGTDGIDGNSPAAGAVADQHTFGLAARMGLDPLGYLAENDSYSFFLRAGGLVETGPTGNNVRDLRIVMSSPAPLGQLRERTVKF